MIRKTNQTGESYSKEKDEKASKAQSKVRNRKAKNKLFKSSCKTRVNILFSLFQDNQ